MLLNFSAAFTACVNGLNITGKKLIVLELKPFQTSHIFL